MSRCRFLIRGAAATDVPLRVLNLFAQQDLRIDHAAIRSDQGSYRISIALTNLASHRALAILEKIRAIVFVEEAELTCDA